MKATVKSALAQSVKVPAAQPVKPSQSSKPGSIVVIPPRSGGSSTVPKVRPITHMAVNNPYDGVQAGLDAQKGWAKERRLKARKVNQPRI